jgi:hypothetical protein
VGWLGLAVGLEPLDRHHIHVAGSSPQCLLSSYVGASSPDCTHLQSSFTTYLQHAPYDVPLTTPTPPQLVPPGTYTMTPWSPLAGG